MDNWHATYLGRRRIPRNLTAFELEAFFSFTAAERSAIRERRDAPELHLGLALQVAFLRMSGRQLDKVGVVPPLLWKHLGAQLGVPAPEVALESARVPSELEGVVAQLKRTFSYTEYRLLDTLILRGSEKATLQANCHRTLKTGQAGTVEKRPPQVRRGEYGGGHARVQGLVPVES